MGGPAEIHTPSPRIQITRRRSKFRYGPREAKNAFIARKPVRVVFFHYLIMIYPGGKGILQNIAPALVWPMTVYFARRTHHTTTFVQANFTSVQCALIAWSEPHPQYHKFYGTTTPNPPFASLQLQLSRIILRTTEFSRCGHRSCESKYLPLLRTFGQAGRRFPPQRH